MILAGDIGGTNTRLAVFDDKLNNVGKPTKFSTGDGTTLEAQALKLLKKHKGTINRASFAIAGPVIDDVCQSTNIGRTYIAKDIGKSLGLQSLVLLNDLVANASGIERLKKTEIFTLIKGEQHDGNRAVVSPGTGLGEGLLAWDGTYHRAQPSEGGHSRFSPTNEIECELLSYMIQKDATVTFEDICSGSGISNIFNFFVELGADVPKALQRQLDKVEPKKQGGLISAAAMQKQSEAAMLTMNLFVRVLGIECANMALKVFATGGVYLGGGIPPKILPLLKTKTFKDAFLKHRTLGGLLKRIPVRVILNDDTALEGAAVYGTRYARS